MSYIINNQSTFNDYTISKQIFISIKQHGKKVAEISTIIGNELKMNDIDLEKLNQSALLHDYGKYYIPQNILLKPSKLTYDEMIIMRKHAYYGSKVAINKNYSKDITDSILYHHENYDGTGYYGVKGEFIPLISRIIRIADVYDALTGDRPYRKALKKEDAVETMKKEKEKYDSNLLNLFINKAMKNYGRRIIK